METIAPVIPGFDPVRELGSGGSASVWLATDRATGNRCAVKCLTEAPVGTEPMDAEASLLREVHMLSGLDHEHLVKVHGVVRLEGGFAGRLGVVMDYAAGGSLGQLVSSRGRLSVGETVTILTPLAQAVAYLHRQGVTHSDVSPGNVLFTAQGKPLLADLGMSRTVGDADAVPDQGTPGFEDPSPVVQADAETARGVGPGAVAPLQPGRDTYALAAVAWYCLTGSAPDASARRPPLALLVPEVPSALVAAIEAGLHPDPRQRPPAGELGTAIFRSAAPSAVDLSGSVDASVIPELATRRRTQRPSKHRGPWLVVDRFGARFKRRLHGAGPNLPGRRRRAVIAVLVLATLALAVPAITEWWADTGAVQTRGTASAEEPQGEDLGNIRSPAPEEALLALSALRDTALATGRPELLEEVNAKGSPAAAADAKVRDELRASGVALMGFATYLSSMRLEDGATPDRASIAVTVRASAYEERNASGQTVRAHATGEAQALRLILVRTDGAWRISEILPAA
ncbi:serine/threonine-protein kinase [bacterium RCC_150]